MADEQIARRPMAEVLREHGVAAEAVERVSVAEVLAGAPDPMMVVSYQQGMGRAISGIDDIYEAVATDGFEDELAVFPVALPEGNAGLLVCQSSDNRWQLYVD